MPAIDLTHSKARFSIVAGGCLATLLVSACLGNISIAAEDASAFNRDVRPILSDNCFTCHGPDEKQRQGDLRLDTKQGAYTVIDPSDSSASELIRRITSNDRDEVMPPADSNKKLEPAQIERLRRWIDAGAKWDEHWSFSPLIKPSIPEVVNANAIIHAPVDSFVQARLAAENVPPSPPADRRTLIRRVSLDLTGLPPAPEDVQAFVDDTTADAYEKVVDRLLRSTAFGERMAWDWLDAARYADTNGYQGDRERTMWPWRDWVIDAFNRNLPFDEFTVWQLAGDLIPNATFEQKLATGFCRNHMINGEGGRIAAENRVDYVMDMTETMGTVWLGLTLNCCRCHDHKYDPLTRRDYYSLFGFFDQTPVTGGGGNPQTPPVIAAPSDQQREQIEMLNQKIAGLDRQLEERDQELADQQPGWEKRQLAEAGDKKDKWLAALRVPPAERSKAQVAEIHQAFLRSDKIGRNLQQQRDDAKKQLESVNKSVPKVMVMRDIDNRRKTFMLDRGLYNKPGEEVSANVPGFLPRLPVAANERPANRLDLARWLVAADQPLTARVIVNRFWQQLFGIGLVKTPEDFGAQGETPPYLDLLNFLAADFRDSGWDVKRLLRSIVTSHTYRQTSDVSPELLARDPKNRLLARGARFRMPSWMLRDQALAASGLLVAKVGGPPVNGYQPPGVWEEATFGKKQYSQQHGESLYRRSLYTFWRRIIAPTMFFDNASRQTCTVAALRTNTPLHALLTLNDVTYVESARTLAEAALAEAEASDQQRIDLVFRRLLARPASEKEQSILIAGLNRSRAEFSAKPETAKQLLSVGESKRNEAIDVAEHASWAALCLAILNLDETLTKE